MLRKLARSQMTAWKQRHVQLVQGGVCPLSLRRFDRKDSADWVIDHDHTTGEIRGVLYRSANAVEGKVKNAVARWGGTGEDYSLVIPYLERLIAYLKSPGTGLMYPMHKTPEELEAAAKQKRRVRAVQKRAAARVKEEQ